MPLKKPWFCTSAVEVIAQKKIDYHFHTWYVYQMGAKPEKGQTSLGLIYFQQKIQSNSLCNSTDKLFTHAYKYKHLYAYILTYLV